MSDAFDFASSSRRGSELIAVPIPRSDEPTTTTKPLTLSTTPLLLCEQVSKWYGPVRGVLQVTLELRSGLTGLVGANGAGKTTLIRLITGQARPDVGRVLVGGHDARSTSARRLVGYCPDVDAFYEEMSGRQFIEAMARLCGYSGAESRRRAGAMLEKVGMTGRAERKLRGYSKGMRQRIKLAQALLHDPPLLVLDEPMSGIDPVGRAEFVTLFKELAAMGKCLLISSHELDELEKLTDHVVIMSHGRVAAADTVPRIRERLIEVPTTIRIDVTRGTNGDDHRRFAAMLMSRLLDLTALEASEPSEEIGRLLVRTRTPRHFLEEVNRLVLEEWFEIVHLKPVDESTQAVLGMLLARRR